ncbi:MAG: cation-translocating P-type ATPase [Thermoguttaceae bacterium]|nr:cation-translocating P-type ATPase [Thermoguttaceae bacterium]
MKIAEQVDSILDWGGLRKQIVLLTVSGAALLGSLFNLFPHAPFDISWIAIVLCGIPLVAEATLGLVTKFDIRAGVLVSIALISSIFVGEYFAAGEVAFIMQLGELLEDLTVARARTGIERLVKLTPATARRLLNGKEEILPAADIMPGDMLRVLPGETVPVDGVIVSGQTSLNQANITGESLPVDKTVGDEVFSGTINQFGAFEMEAVKTDSDSFIQRMIKLVQSADADKAKVVRIADRWATWVVAAALLTALVAWCVTGEIIRAVSILVVFCPCSLVLATPTAIMAAIGNATKHGFLVKEGDALERLASVTRVAFDKTGTLTVGAPNVALVKSFNREYSDEETYKLAAAVEQYSEHPLGKAIVRRYREETQNDIPSAEGFETTPGKGVRCEVDGKLTLAGNERMLAESGVELNAEQLHEIDQERRRGRTVVVVAQSKTPIGFVSLGDSLRTNAKSVVATLLALYATPTLLTGDNSHSANHFASELGIKDVHANCLPEDKLNFIGEYQKKNDLVCMIGDGVNDAPALKIAHVGIAMGGIGSDVAAEASDITLVGDDVKELPHLFALSKKMMRKIVFNLSLSMAINLVAVIFAALGMLGPVVGALVHNGGSFFVIANSALLLGYQACKFDSKSIT